MRRLFFALPLSAEQKQQVSDFTLHNLHDDSNLNSNIGKPVSSNNYHITLAFIGQVTDEQYRQLVELGDKIFAPFCQFNADFIGYWSKPKVLYLGAEKVPETIKQLQLMLLSELEKFPQINERFHPPKIFKPHITLYRKAKYLVGVDEFGEMVFHFERFCLFESISTNQGVIYKELHSWPLFD